ncbi:MAG: PQQ-dependent sugar dehydrogenase [Methanobacterium sp.]|uniref:PQQ-dependent sugar dehydrogenase n=1 Tax=Methanobacterium sp. TaxID=2164 RepID=UPI003D65BAAE|nr:PQQ-dependent sugar dehydrogenase [Methanobacterium sp.]
MKNKYIIIFVFTILILITLIFILKPVNQPTYQTEVMALNLDTPWAIDFLPDDTMIFTERNGKVSILKNGTSKIIGNINITQIGESGLLGIAVDPNFNENRFIYLYYTVQNSNRLSRFTLNEKLENETILINNIPGGQIHNGGRIKFGPDGFLYITTGEAGNKQLAQNINSTGGKILRINKNGTIPSDNPFGNYVYSYGHRDPQGITWNPQSKEMYSSEHGETRYDEINIILKGGNYGWPIYQGNNSPQGYIKPLIFYTDFTLAPSGIAYYNSNLYVSGLRGSQLRKISLSADGKTVTGEEALFTNLGRIREVVEHKGYLYISTSNRDGRGVPQSGDDKIIRIKL